jgi:hypothetical protein
MYDIRRYLTSASSRRRRELMRWKVLPLSAPKRSITIRLDTFTID